MQTTESGKKGGASNRPGVWGRVSGLGGVGGGGAKRKRKRESVCVGLVLVVEGGGRGVINFHQAVSSSWWLRISFWCNENDPS